MQIPLTPRVATAALVLCAHGLGTACRAPTFSKWCGPLRERRRVSGRGEACPWRAGRPDRRRACFAPTTTKEGPRPRIATGAVAAPLAHRMPRPNRPDSLASRSPDRTPSRRGRPGPNVERRGLAQAKARGYLPRANRRTQADPLTPRVPAAACVRRAHAWGHGTPCPHQIRVRVSPIPLHINLGAAWAAAAGCRSPEFDAG